MVQKVSQNVIIEGLKEGWGISETKHYHKIFKMTQWGVKGRLPFVPLSYADLEIGIKEI